MKNKTSILCSVFIVGILVGVSVGFLGKLDLRKKDGRFSINEKNPREIEILLRGERLLVVSDEGGHESVLIARDGHMIASISIDDSKPTRGVTGIAVVMDNKKEGRVLCDVINCDFSDDGDSIEFTKRPYVYQVGSLR